MILARDWLFLPSFLDNVAVLNNTRQPHNKSCHFQPHFPFSCEQLCHRHGFNDGSYLLPSKWIAETAVLKDVCFSCSDQISLVLSNLPTPTQEWGARGGGCRGKPCRDLCEEGQQDTASQGLFWRHGIGKLSVQLNSLHARSQSGPPSMASPEPGIQQMLN